MALGTLLASDYLQSGSADEVIFTPYSDSFESWSGGWWNDDANKSWAALNGFEQPEIPEPIYAMEDSSNANEKDVDATNQSDATGIMPGIKLPQGGLLAQTDLKTGADAAISQKQNATVGKETSVMDLLNSKVGAGIATSLVSGLLGGVGSGAAAKANNKAQKELLDQKYQQQLDYVRQMRKVGKINTQEWKPSLSNGILGAK